MQWGIQDNFVAVEFKCWAVLEQWHLTSWGKYHLSEIQGTLKMDANLCFIMPNINEKGKIYHHKVSVTWGPGHANLEKY